MKDGAENEVQALRRRVAELEASLATDRRERAKARRDGAEVPADRPPRGHTYLAGLIEGTNDVVFAKNLQGRYEVINGAGARVFGLPRTQIIGKDNFQLLDPDTARRMAENERRVTATGSPVVFEESLNTALGPGTWLTSMGPWRDEQGNVIGVVGISRDITERKNAQRALQFQSEVIRRLGAGVVVLRAKDAVIVYANRCFERMFGYEPGELNGKLAPVLNAPRPDATPEEVGRKIIDELDENGSWAGQVLNIRKDGSTFWSCAIVTTLESPEHGKVRVSVNEDISERKRAEQALQFHSEVVRRLGAGVCVVREKDAAIVYTNKHFEEMFGYGPGELIGRRPEVLNADGPDGGPQDTMRKIIDSLDENGSWEGEVLNIRKDGGLFWSHAIVTTLESPEHGPVWISVSRDISQRKRAEQAVRRARSRLTSAREVERKRLAGELHDSIGQGLVALKLALDAEGRGSLSQQCTKLIQEIRHLCGGLYPQTLDSLGLISALRRLGKQCEPTMRFQLHCPSNLLEARFGPDEEIALFRIAQEATSNAIRHSRAANIEFSLEHRDGRICLEIVDDGCGFDTTGQCSQGLGRRMMQERAEAVDGSLEITSRPGRTRVRVSVPFTTPAN